MNVSRFLHGGILAAALLGIASAYAADAPPPGTVSPASKSSDTLATTTPASTSDNSTTRLNDVQSALTKAQAALDRATLSTHGGFVQKAQAEIKQALKYVAAGLTYIEAHPEADALQNAPATQASSPDQPASPPGYGTYSQAQPEANPPPLAPTDDTGPFVKPASPPSYSLRADGSQISPNLAHAMTALDEALTKLEKPQATAGDNSPTFTIGDLDGNRNRILSCISRANTDILSAYNYAQVHSAAGRAASGT
jgi:hypothetical protein